MFDKCDILNIIWIINITDIENKYQNILFYKRIKMKQAWSHGPVTYIIYLQFKVFW